jgi:hypothetical protein
MEGGAQEQVGGVAFGDADGNARAIDIGDGIQG